MGGQSGSGRRSSAGLRHGRYGWRGRGGCGGSAFLLDEGGQGPCAFEELGGEDDGGVLLGGDLGKDLEVAQLGGDRVVGDDVGGLGEAVGGEGLALGRR
ncbi:hypothetical protein ABZX88_29175 [Kitasatospora aureofaciens]|uniref:hypothetical protein n=1 Tax=Kitasatospora aureofaciens TaxID=1894 RepID=UPI0033B726C8